MKTERVKFYLKVINQLLKKKLSHKEPGDLSFFHFKWIYLLQNPCVFLKKICYGFEIFFLILKNEGNVPYFGYVFVTRLHITHNNFPGDWTSSCTVITSIFVKNTIFKNVKKNWKNSHVFWKINKFIWN